MDIGAIFIALALLVLTIPFLVGPFKKQKNKKGQKSIEKTDSEADRKSLLLAVRDLDFDYKTGKVAEEDYNSLRSQMLARVASLDALSNTIDEAIEQEIASRRKCSSNGKGCPNCKTRLKTDDQFCPKCGTGISLFCSACGGKLASNAKFCSLCGDPVLTHLDRVIIS
jgi:rRNA maturation endonuclease Nob1